MSTTNHQETTPTTWKDLVNLNRSAPLPTPSNEVASLSLSERIDLLGATFERKIQEKNARIRQLVELIDDEILFIKFDDINNQSRSIFVIFKEIVSLFLSERIDLLDATFERKIQKKNVRIRQLIELIDDEIFFIKLDDINNQSRSIFVIFKKIVSLFISESIDLLIVKFERIIQEKNVRIRQLIELIDDEIFFIKFDDINNQSRPIFVIFKKIVSLSLFERIDLLGATFERKIQEKNVRIRQLIELIDDEIFFIKLDDINNQSRPIFVIFKEIVSLFISESIDLLVAKFERIIQEKDAGIRQLENIAIGYLKLKLKNEEALVKEAQQGTSK